MIKEDKNNFETFHKPLHSEVKKTKDPTEMNNVDELSQDLHYLQPLSPNYGEGLLVKKEKLLPFHGEDKLVKEKQLPPHHGACLVVKERKIDKDIDEEDWQEMNSSIWSTVHDGSIEPKVQAETMKEEVHDNEDASKEENGKFDGNNNAHETVPQRLHVSSIPFRFREDNLVMMFKDYGTVLDAEIIFNERGSKGFGFVTIDNSQNAEKAKKALDGMEIEGRRIEVNKANKRTIQINKQAAAAQSYMAMVGNGQKIINGNYFGEGVNDDKDAALKTEPKDVLSKIISNGDNYEAISKRLHVSNIPFRFKENDLKMLFENYGTVLDAEIIHNDKGSKGFGFVTLDSAENASKAKKELDEKEVEGRIIEVNNATKRTLQKKQQASIVRDLMPAEPKLDTAALAAIAAARLVAGDGHCAGDVLAHALRMLGPGTSTAATNNAPTDFYQHQPMAAAAIQDTDHFYGSRGSRMYNESRAQMYGQPGSHMYEAPRTPINETWGSSRDHPSRSQMYDQHISANQVFGQYGSLFEMMSTGDNVTRNDGSSDGMFQNSGARPGLLSEFFNEKFFNFGR